MLSKNLGYILAWLYRIAQVYYSSSLCWNCGRDVFSEPLLALSMFSCLSGCSAKLLVFPVGAVLILLPLWAPWFISCPCGRCDSSIARVGAVILLLTLWALCLFSCPHGRYLFSCPSECCASSLALVDRGGYSNFKMIANLPCSHAISFSRSN